MEVCKFLGALDESNELGRKFTCIHGKTLTYSTARYYLGLITTAVDLIKEIVKNEDK